MTDDKRGRLEGAGRWTTGALVVGLLVCPLARLTMGQGAAADSQQARAVRALTLSFEQYQAGQYQDAIASARAALAVNPNSADAYNNLAVSYLALHKYDDAITAAQDAIRLAPDYQLAKNNLAWIRQEEAKAAAVPVAAPTPADALLTQSLDHANAGRYTQCIDTATRSATLNPNSAAAFNNIGFCAANLRRWDEAIRNTQKAIRLDPDSQLARNNLAWMQQQRLLPAAPKSK